MTDNIIMVDQIVRQQEEILDLRAQLEEAERMRRDALIEMDRAQSQRKLATTRAEKAESEAEALRAENARLREALERIADMAEVDLDIAPQIAREALSNGLGNDQ